MLEQTQNTITHGSEVRIARLDNNNDLIEQVYDSQYESSWNASVNLSRYAIAQLHAEDEANRYDLSIQRGVEINVQNPIEDAAN